ncbi:MAG: hypothetical protein HRT69_08780 [Flavobacteriaceae bacterium]|nr:hypothetical protein [Flavobacteriaceae bacterium]
MFFISKERSYSLFETLKTPEDLKAYFEFFKEQMDYATIRLALSVIEKEEQ